MVVLTAGAAENKTLKHMRKRARNLGNPTHHYKEPLYWISFYFNPKGLDHDGSYVL